MIFRKTEEERLLEEVRREKMSKEVELVNLTPHRVVILLLGHRRVEIPPSGTVARVSVRAVPHGSIGGIPVVRTEYGDITDLPEPKRGTVFIVPTLVLVALRAKGIQRDDLVAPDTSPASAVRDEAGRIVAVRRFQVL